MAGKPQAVNITTEGEIRCRHPMQTSDADQEPGTTRMARMKWCECFVAVIDSTRCSTAASAPEEASWRVQAQTLRELGPGPLASQTYWPYLS